MTNLEAFFDAFAGAIVCANKQRKWRLNLPVIAATGQACGVTEAEINQGGKHYDEIMRRVGELGATVAGFDIRADAKQTAEDLFGPKGDWAQNFMKRSAWRL